MSLFDQMVHTVREDAVRVLERSAHQRGTIISVCMECKGFIREVDGQGNSGISDGLCDKCFAEIPEAEVPTC
jgi:hypothetical protein